jgi:hypothetical protein
MKGKKTEKKQKGKKTCIILIAPQALDVACDSTNLMI